MAKAKMQDDFGHGVASKSKHPKWDPDEKKQPANDTHMHIADEFTRTNIRKESMMPMNQHHIEANDRVDACGRMKYSEINVMC